MNKLLFLLTLHFFLYSGSSELVVNVLAGGDSPRSLSAQTADEKNRQELRRERFARIKTAHEAFLIERLELTEKEAAAFLPVFWEQQEKRRALHKPGRKYRARSASATRAPLTEAEALQLIEDRHETLATSLRILREADQEYLKVLPATKVIRIPEVERAFRNELRDRVSERRKRH